MRSGLLACLVTILLGLLLGQVASAQVSVTFDVPALTKAPAPGVDDGSSFSRLFTPAINSNGQVVFHAALEIGGVRRGQGIWMWDGVAPTRLIVRDGDSTPTGELAVDFSDRFNSIGQPAFSDAGEVAFSAIAIHTEAGVPTSSIIGVWLSDLNGQLSKLLRSDEPVPGVTGSTFSRSHGLVGIADGPKVHWKHSLNGAINDFGIWSGSVTEGMKLVSRTTFDPENGGFNEVWFNRTGGGVVRRYTSANRPSVWRILDNNLSLVARLGDPIPGSPDGMNWPLISRVRINDRGDIALGSTYYVWVARQDGTFARFDVGENFRDQSTFWMKFNDNEDVVVTGRLDATSPQSRVAILRLHE